MTVRTLLASLLLLQLSASCAVTDALVGTILDASSEGAPDARSDADAAVVCRSNSDCDGGFCNLSSCASGSEGYCTLRPDPSDCTSGDDRPHVCGCDGVTYWNECWSQVYGQPLRDPTDRCASWDAVPCFRGDTSSCPIPSEMHCAIELGVPMGDPGQPPTNCSPPLRNTGTCWVVPSGTCPSTFGTYVVCGDGSNPAGFLCTDLCTAISTDEPFQDAVISGTCPSAGP